MAALPEEGSVNLQETESESWEDDTDIGKNSFNQSFFLQAFGLSPTRLWILSSLYVAVLAAAEWQAQPDR